MIDLLLLRIPFIDSIISYTPDFIGGTIDLSECNKRGCRLESGDIILKPQEKSELYTGALLAEVSNLRHPFESLPSSWSNLAFKVRAGGKNYLPFVEIKASPAKLLQGHNVYGSCDVNLCMGALIVAFSYALPEMCEILDFKNIELGQIDCTFTAHLEKQSDRRNVISALKHISNGQTKGSKSAFDTTVYFGKGSRHKKLKVYLKEFELQDQTKKAELNFKKKQDVLSKNQLDILTDESVIKFAKNSLRFEASIMPRMLKRLAIPTNIWEFEEYSSNFKGCLIQELFNKAWSDIFKTFEGANMNNFSDEEIQKKLREKYSKTTTKFDIKTGANKITVSNAKADRIFRFFRMLKHEGYDEAKGTYPKATFYRSMKDLTAVVPKAYLQNLLSIASNVVPLIQFVKIDFSKQHPNGYQEPKNLSTQFTNGLRLVS